MYIIATTHSMHYVITNAGCGMSHLKHALIERRKHEEHDKQVVVDIRLLLSKGTDYFHDGT